MSAVLAMMPRYETLELVVPEVQLRERYRRGWLVVATIVAFLVGLFIGYAAPRAAQEGSAAAGTSRTPGLLGAPPWSVSPDERDARLAPFRAGLVGGAPLPAVAQAIPLTGSVLALTGYATFYDVAPGNAAAGPALRAWLGDWRGQTVKVCHRGCILVSLTDWCACGDRSGKSTLVDLSRTDFAVLGDPSAGVISVTVSRGGVVALPATDTAP